MADIETDSMLNTKAHTKAEDIEDKLKKNLPKTYIIVNSTLIILASLTLICLQVIIIRYKLRNYFVGSGIWVGCFLICVAICDLSLIPYRSVKLFKAIQVLHILGTLMTQGGIIILNIFTYRNYPEDTQTDLKKYHLIIFGVGIGCAFLCSTFLSILRIRLKLCNCCCCCCSNSSSTAKKRTIL